MTDPSLSTRFEENRPRLRAVAYRLLGSTGEAEDAVQETWLRVARAELGEVDNLVGWLTTVITHVCLDMLRARKTRENIWLCPRQDEPARGGPCADRLAKPEKCCSRTRWVPP